MGQITSPIIQIINTSIDKDIFLDSWKVARVCPIPKIDNPVTVRNFRPISILSVLSKVYEKSILSQLLNYIEKSAVYNPTQSGFRKGHSTITLWKALSRNEIISVLTDYSKAFDAINQKTLLEKLVSLNFSNRMIKNIISYLTNQTITCKLMTRLHLNLQFTFEFPKKVSWSNSLWYISSRTTILYILRFSSICWRNNYLQNMQTHWHPTRNM